MAGASVRAIPLADKDVNDDFDDGELGPIADAIEMEEAIAGEFADSDIDVVFQIRVHQLPGTSKTAKGIREVYLFTCDQSEYENINDRLRDDFGSGLYRVRLWARQGSKKKTLRKCFDIEVRAPEKKTDIIAPAVSNDLTAVMRMVEESSRRQQDFMERMLSDRRDTPKEVDPFDMMEKLSNIMANMQRGNAPAATTTNDPTELVLKGVELAERFGSKSGGDGGGIADLIREAIKSPLVETIVKSALARQVAPPAAAPTLHNVPPPPQLTPAAQSTTTAPESPPPQAPTSLQEMFAGQIAYLLEKAKANYDPEIYANWFFVELPPEETAYLCNTPGVLDQAIALVPEVVAHRDWFEEFIELMKDNLAEFEKPKDAPPPDKPDAA